MPARAKSIATQFILGLLSLGALSLLTAFIGYYLTPDVPDLLGNTAILNNIGLFIFINTSITLVLLFAYLVLKNLVKLVIDRKSRVSGSGLRTRLVATFIGLAIVPTALLFFISKAILSAVQDGWLAPQVSATVNGSLNVARAYYDSLENQLFLQAEHLRDDSMGIYPLLLASLAGGNSQASSQGYSSSSDSSPQLPSAFSQLLNDFLRRKRQEYGLLDISVYNSTERPLGFSSHQEWDVNLETAPPPNPVALRQALAGELLIKPENSLNTEYLRAYAPLRPPLKPLQDREGNALGTQTHTSVNPQAESKLDGDPAPAGYAVVLTYAIPPSISRLLSEMLDANADYQALLVYHRPLASSYILTLMVVTVIITFAAVWVGFHLAERLTVPIELLAEGTQQIAKGNLEHRIPDVGDDELRVLVQSFNLMTHDLRKTTTEVVAKRRYMETVLHNVGVGVISIDNDERIETLNHAAANILRVPQPELGRRLYQILQVELYHAFKQAITDIEEKAIDSTSTTLSLLMAGESKHLQIIVSRLRGETSNILGHVLLIDDLTALVKAQRLAAWREVAQRIAHEIKNPLTPIQLSAQRIQKRLNALDASGSPLEGAEIPEKERQVVNEGTALILSQVNILKRLVNEFSQFARMPTTTLQLINLNDLLSETTGMYRGLHPYIDFVCEFDRSLPALQLDRVQISQLLVNLLDNAIFAIKSGNGSGRILIKTHYDTLHGLATLRIEDNGTGIPDSDKPRLFEPYFSTKQEGTGLGLAIVSNIARDHGATVRVLDNNPSGAIFCVDFPVSFKELI